MKGRLFWLLTFGIFFISIVLHILAVRDNHFFFTVDQGRDAVYVREIINYHSIFLRGPETTIRGIYTGPLWYYFLAVGYLIFKGNPFGGIFMLLILNLGTTLFLIWWVGKKIGKIEGLVAGFALQLNWGFFYTSLWAFNPFPLVSLSIILIIILTKFLSGAWPTSLVSESGTTLLVKGKRNYYFLALVPIIFAFNTEVAGALALLIFYILVGFVGVLKKHLSLKAYFVSAFLLPALGLLRLFYEALIQFIKSGSFYSGPTQGLGVASSTNFEGITKEFLNIFSNAVVPQNTTLSFLIFLAAIFLLILNKARVKKSIARFIFLTFLLTLVSYLFFASNRGWRDWHTVYLAPLIFISLLLAILSLPKKIGFLILAFVMFFQIKNFGQRYFSYTKESGDPSLLSNQLKIIDWVYTQSEGNGFSIYTYTNTFYDYPYQYLFSWYGKPKYGFYPCEYSNFPDSLKTLYIPGYEHYNEPKLGCDKWRYLIIESDTNGEKNKEWIREFSIMTRLIDTTYIGKTKIEKRAVRTD